MPYYSTSFRISLVTEVPLSWLNWQVFDIKEKLSKRGFSLRVIRNEYDLLVGVEGLANEEELQVVRAIIEASPLRPLIIDETLPT